MKNYEILMINSTELQRIVKIYVKLPYDYDVTNKDYSTIYFHDGQVVFNDFETHDTSFGLLENYITSKSNDAIIVGIASGKSRIDELCPFEITRKSGETVGGKTTKYISFIVDTLIPEINRLYRAKNHRDFRAMVGVSLGGLCTYYSLSKYSNQFSRFAIISSSHYQVHDQLIKMLKNANLKSIKRIYSDVGTNENEREDVCEKYISTNKEMYELLRNKLDINVFKSKIIEGSKHELEDWNKRSTDILKFILS